MTYAAIISFVATLYAGKVLTRKWREKKAKEALREKVRGRLGIGAENGHRV